MLQVDFLLFQNSLMEVCPDLTSSATKKRLVSETPSIEPKSEGEEESPRESGRSGIDILDLKSKLEKMGTNVSLAPGGSGPARAVARIGGLPEAAITTAAGISVIRNGEAFIMANIAEVKLNFDESNRQLSPSRPTKPSCTVRPIMKPLPVKPLATVRPLMQNESQLGAALGPDNTVESPTCVNGFSQTAAGSPEVSTITSTKLVHINGATKPSSPLHVKPLSALPLSGEVSSPAPPVAHVAAMQKTDLESTENRVMVVESKPPGQAESKPPVPEPKSPVINVPGGEVGLLNGDRSHALPAVSSASVVVLSDAEDIFNTDIVCPHGNLRIEERCKQLISRDAWFRLCNYFDRPKTFQFGKNMIS